jgi:hypothetical protein
VIQFQTNVGTHPGTLDADGTLVPSIWAWEVGNGPALAPSLPDPQPVVEQFTKDFAAYRATQDAGRAPVLAYRTVAIAQDEAGDFTQIVMDYTHRPDLAA